MKAIGARMIGPSFNVSYLKIIDAVRGSVVVSRSNSDPSPLTFEPRAVYKGHHHLLNCRPAEEF
jgi:hypothetical protein